MVIMKSVIRIGIVSVFLSFYAVTIAAQDISLNVTFQDRISRMVQFAL